MGTEATSSWIRVWGIGLSVIVAFLCLTCGAQAQVGCQLAVSLTINPTYIKVSKLTNPPVDLAVAFNNPCDDFAGLYFSEPNAPESGHPEFYPRPSWYPNWLPVGFALVGLGQLG